MYHHLEMVHLTMSCRQVFKDVVLNVYRNYGNVTGDVTHFSCLNVLLEPDWNETPTDQELYFSLLYICFFTAPDC